MVKKDEYKRKSKEKKKLKNSWTKKCGTGSIEIAAVDEEALEEMPDSHTLLVVPE